MIDLVFISQKRPEPKINTFKVKIPEDMEREIIAAVTARFGQVMDVYIQPIQVSVFDYSEIKDEDK